MSYIWWLRRMFAWCRRTCPSATTPFPPHRTRIVALLVGQVQKCARWLCAFSNTALRASSRTFTLHMLSLWVRGWGETLRCRQSCARCAFLLFASTMSVIDTNRGPNNDSARIYAGVCVCVCASVLAEIEYAFHSIGSVRMICAHSELWTLPHMARKAARRATLPISTHTHTHTDFIFRSPSKYMSDECSLSLAIFNQCVNGASLRRIKSLVRLRFNKSEKCKKIYPTNHLAHITEARQFYGAYVCILHLYNIRWI